MAEMTAEEAAEWGKTLSFEKVWAVLLKMGERVDKLGERVDKTAEQVDKAAETVNKLGERVDRVTANVGGLNQSMGELIETLFASHLGEKFDSYQYQLRRTYKRLPLYDDTNRLRAEIDLLLSNTTVCMAVEVKRWLDQMRQVDEHVKRMGLIRQ
ncbi:MAG: hypothetical protein LBD93_10505, partial [Treponema sp.]|nr:hypothetical protein [Treponema sp.]